MQRGRPKAELIIPPEDLATLQRWTARRKTAQALALRSQILLRCASGLSNTEVARELGVVNATVGKWRSRYIAKGLAGLLDEQRCGAPRRIGDDQVEAVLVKTLETTPRDATHWSTRSMAAGTGLSRPTINRIWRAFGLQPHRAESFKLSNDPQFIEKVRDIVGLYLNPPGTSPGALHRREGSDPSTGSHPAHLPDSAGHARAADPDGRRDLRRHPAILLANI